MEVLATSGARNSTPARETPQEPITVPCIYDDIRDAAIWILLIASLQRDSTASQSARIAVSLLKELEDYREKELDELCF